MSLDTGSNIAQLLSDLDVILDESARPPTSLREVRADHDQHVT
jgi:hypothetical protein